MERGRMLREELAERLQIYFGCQHSKDEVQMVADQILALVTDAGYVKLAADQGLPELQFVPQDTKKNQILFDHYLAGYNNALSKAYQLGWRKVETKAEKP